MTTSYTAVQIQTHGGRNKDTVSVHVPDTGTEPPQNKRRWIGGTIAVIVVAAIIAVVIWRTCQPETFSKRFIRKCLECKKDNNESYCQHVFDVFERAYVGKPESKVSVEDYDDLLAEVPFNHPCHQTMFWSKTNELVHKYTKDKGKKDCFTQEDALLGNILDNETWCGKEGSNETFTDGCQGLNYTGNTAVLSFWNRASAASETAAAGRRRLRESPPLSSLVALLACCVTRTVNSPCSVLGKTRYRCHMKDAPLCANHNMGCCDKYCNVGKHYHALSHGRCH